MPREVDRLQTFSTTVTNAVGLHARPAASIVQVAQDFVSEILISNGNQQANAKSILAVLALGAGVGTHLIFTIQGSDEAQALRLLTETVASSLGPIRPGNDEPRSHQEGASDSKEGIPS